MDRRLARRVLGLFTACAAALVAPLAGCGQKQAADSTAAGPPPMPVSVQTVGLGTIQQTLQVTGSLAALEDVTLSAKATGRVTMVTVREGDIVHAGELIVQQDTTDLQANVDQQKANVLSAQAKLAEAISTYNVEVITAKQDVLKAQATLEQNREDYLKTFRGSRPQEVLEAQTQVDSAKANMENALITLNRDKTLYAQGAIAKSQVDTDQTTYDVDLQTFNNATQAYQLTVIGNRQEDIAAAKALVDQSKNSLAEAEANVAVVSQRKDDIIAARAAIAQAQAQLDYDQRQVAFASIVSPINGIVAARETEPGQEANPGTDLMRIVNIRTVYYEPAISETDFSETAVGQPVSVGIDAYPGRVFNGKVVAVFPAKSASNRQFSLRVNVDNPTNELRPGMFARGSIVTKVAHNVTIVPSTALFSAATQTGFAPNTSSNMQVAQGTVIGPQDIVVLRPDNTVEIRPVTIGIQTDTEAQILSGVNAGDTIVTAGQQMVHTGDKVAVINKNGNPVTAQSSAGSPSKAT